MESQRSHLAWYPGHDLLLPNIVRAENCRLYDAQGKTYVDLESGVWCTPLGHGHPRILRAIAEQSTRIAHTGFNYSCKVVEEAAADILSLLGFDGGQCVFLCSGSEAVEYGVRVAQAIAGRPLLLTMSDSYFGAYGSASRRLENEWFVLDWSACDQCSEDAGCDERCPHLAAIPWEQIGGFLFEPGSASGLVRFPPRPLIHRIVRLLGQNDGLVLVNEVTTGVGRTGAWFGHQHYGIKPDIVALGKGIGNGYPVSVAAFAPRVTERLGKRTIKYAQSHQNDPLGAAVAHEVVRIIREEGLIERAMEISALLVGGLDRIKAHTPRIKAVRARGLMAAIELDDDAQCSFTLQVHRELVRRGFVVGRRPGVNVLRLDPSLTIPHREVQDFLTALAGVLTAT